MLAFVFPPSTRARQPSRRSPRRRSISTQSLCSTRTKLLPLCGFILRPFRDMHGKGLSGACSSVPCGDSAQATSTAGSPSVLLDRKISTKPLPGVR